MRPPPLDSRSGDLHILLVSFDTYHLIPASDHRPDHLRTGAAIGNKDFPGIRPLGRKGEPGQPLGESQWLDAGMMVLLRLDALLVPQALGGSLVGSVDGEIVQPGVTFLLGGFRAVEKPARTTSIAVAIRGILWSATDSAAVELLPLMARSRSPVLRYLPPLRIGLWRSSSRAASSSKATLAG